MKESIERQREKHGLQQTSQLFLLRVWMPRKNECDGLEDLAGKLQDPVSGAVHYFSGGLELVQILHRTIYQEETPGPAGKADSHEA